MPACACETYVHLCLHVLVRTCVRLCLHVHLRLGRHAAGTAYLLVSLRGVWLGPVRENLPQRHPV